MSILENILKGKKKVLEEYYAAGWAIWNSLSEKRKEEINKIACGKGK